MENDKEVLNRPLRLPLGDVQAAGLRPFFMGE